MSYERTAIIQNESGIHARVAAGIVQRAKELAEKYGFRQALLELAEKKCHSAQNTAF